MNAFEFLPEICKRFNQNNVKYIVIGGCAVNLHGFLRNTLDIDYVIELNEQNIEQIKNALIDLLPEINEINFDLMKNYYKGGVIRLGMHENFCIDLLVKIRDIDYERLNKNAEIIIIEDIKIFYAGLDDMIKLKSGYREIDQRDILFLQGKKEYIQKHKK